MKFLAALICLVASVFAAVFLASAINEAMNGSWWAAALWGSSSVMALMAFLAVVYINKKEVK